MLLKFQVWQVNQLKYVLYVFEEIKGMPKRGWSKCLDKREKGKGQGLVMKRINQKNPNKNSSFWTAWIFIKNPAGIYLHKRNNRNSRTGS